MGAKRPHHQTFADLLAEEDGQARQSVPPPEPIPSPFDADEFTDDWGVTWKRRGGGLVARDLARKINDPKLTVLHEYLGEVNEVPVTARRAFWEEAERRMRESEYADFYGQEFKSEDRRYLVVITEVC